MAEKRIQELKERLTRVERDKKCVEVALEEAERQAEGQGKQLCQIEDQLTASKEKVTTLKKKLEAKDQAE